jgi:mannose-6-phosphate isomerase-like protein (cupin superfamily)
MKTKRVTMEEGLGRLPAADDKRFATVFAHGTLVVEVYAPRGTDAQQPHARDEVYVVARGWGEFVAGGERTEFGVGDFSSPRPASHTASRISRKTSPCG